MDSILQQVDTVDPDILDSADALVRNTILLVRGASVKGDEPGG